MGILLSFIIITVGHVALAAGPKYIDKINTLALKDIKDPDFKAARSLNERWAHIQLHTFSDERNRIWRLQIIKNKLKDGPTWFVPHDDENSAFLSGIYAIKKYGGTLLAFDCKERRRCGRIDPNRNFSRRNRIYTKIILSYFKNENFPVLTLHNNHNGHNATGGSGVIYSRIQSPYRHSYASFSGGDPDNMIIFADNKKRKHSRVFKEFSDLFDRLKLNYIFEYANPRGRSTGHMSNYVIRETRMGYFNIEAQFGWLRTQKSHVDRVMLALDDPSTVKLKYALPTRKPAMTKRKPTRKKKRRRRKRKPKKDCGFDPFGFCNK